MQTGGGLSLKLAPKPMFWCNWWLLFDIDVIKYVLARLIGYMCGIWDTKRYFLNFDVFSLFSYFYVRFAKNPKNVS